MLHIAAPPSLEKERRKKESCFVQKRLCQRGFCRFCFVRFSLLVCNEELVSFGLVCVIVRATLSV